MAITSNRPWHGCPVCGEREVLGYFCSLGCLWIYDLEPRDFYLPPRREKRKKRIRQVGPPAPIRYYKARQPRETFSEYVLMNDGIQDSGEYYNQGINYAKWVARDLSLIHI